MCCLFVYLNLKKSQRPTAYLVEPQLTIFAPQLAAVPTALLSNCCEIRHFFSLRPVIKNTFRGLKSSSSCLVRPVGLRPRKRSTYGAHLNKQNGAATKSDAFIFLSPYRSYWDGSAAPLSSEKPGRKVRLCRETIETRTNSQHFVTEREVKRIEKIDRNQV